MKSPKMLWVETPTPDFARELAQTLRPADAAELERLGEGPVYEVLLRGIRDSEDCWVALLDGQVFAMWGVVPTASTAGSGWLLTSNLVDRYPMLFWKATQVVLHDLLSRWGMLFNWIDADHHQALRWAKRLGFRLSSPEPYGRFGCPFVRFTVTQEDFDVRSRSNGRHGGDNRSSDGASVSAGESRGRPSTVQREADVGTSV